MPFPVSVKGVLMDGDTVVLLENERKEWELPGGRLESGEESPRCLVREFQELAADVVCRPHFGLLALRGASWTRSRHRDARGSTY
jgi:ADP-ribose pyrophosphatase YjhB (NUDIX family)